MFEAIVLFPRDLPSVTMLRERVGGSALFDAIAGTCAPNVIASYLADPSQPLIESERERIVGAHVGLKLDSRTTEHWPQVAHFVELASVLFEHGASAIVLPAALRVFGAAQLARAFLEPTEIECWLALFVHHHAVAQGDHVWLHTHGMEHFALPDVEIVEPLPRAGHANRVIRAVLHRLVTGPPLRLGDVIEHGGDTARFRLEPSLPIDDHAFGLHNAVRLHRVTELSAVIREVNQL